jgi:hypothetical protein
MTVIDSMFDEFFSKRIPHEGFVIDPTNHFGLIEERMRNDSVLSGFAITMSGDVIVQQLNPTLNMVGDKRRIAA